MKNKKRKLSLRKSIDQVLKEFNQGIKIDLGGGASPQPGFVNIDIRDLPEVDIVHNLELFPWPLPSECASLIMASHLLEHINPTPPDPRTTALIELLLKKKILKPQEVKLYIGEVNPGPRFIRFMDEAWRILKPKGQLIAALPYGGSTGFWQDPTHINGCNEITWAYFDPLEAGGLLYKIYKPKPWKIIMNTWQQNGNMEIILEKRLIDKSYYL